MTSGQLVRNWDFSVLSTRHDDLKTVTGMTSGQLVASCQQGRITSGQLITGILTSRQQSRIISGQLVGDWILTSCQQHRVTSGQGAVEWRGADCKLLCTHWGHIFIDLHRHWLVQSLISLILRVLQHSLLPMSVCLKIMHTIIIMVNIVILLGNVNTSLWRQ